MVTAQLQTKRLSYKMSAYDEEQGIFEGYASVWDVTDADGDIVLAGAFAHSLAQGAAQGGVKLLAQHEDHALPLGKSLELREDEHGLWIKGYISPTSSGQDYRQLIKDGVIDSLSIGYIDMDSETDAAGVRRLKQVDLIEISLVTYPANDLATIAHYKSTQGGTNMAETTTQETPTEFGLEELRALITEGVKAALADNEAKSDTGNEDEDKSDDADDEAKNTDEDEEDGMRDKTKGRKSAASQQEDIERKYASIYIPTPTKTDTAPKLPPGISWARAVKCVALGGGDPERAAHIAAGMYKDTPKLARNIKALSVTNPRDGGYLVPEQYAADVIPLLYAKSILHTLGATVVPMDGGNLTMPKMTAGSTASYVGELREGKESKPSFGAIKMSSKKLMTHIPMSNDLLRSNSYAADQIVLDDLTNSMALRKDTAGLQGAGSEFEPKGIFSMDGIPTMTIGKVDISTTGRMFAKLLQANADTTKLGWAINAYAWEAFYNVANAMGLHVYRDQMDAGKLGGHIMAVGNKAIRTGGDAKGLTKIVLGNWSDFLIGEEGGMEVEIFREGSIGMGDHMFSALSNDASILRVICKHDFAVRHEASFVIGTVETK